MFSSDQNQPPPVDDMHESDQQHAMHQKYYSIENHVYIDPAQRHFGYVPHLPCPTDAYGLMLPAAPAPIPTYEAFMTVDHQNNLSMHSSESTTPVMNMFSKSDMTPNSDESRRRALHEQMPPYFMYAHPYAFHPAVGDFSSIDPAFVKPVIRKQQPQQTKKPRAQVKKACVHCQKACKKCDDVRPCSRCVKMNLSDSCVDAPRKARESGKPRGPYKRKSSLGLTQDAFNESFVQDKNFGNVLHLKNVAGTALPSL